MALRTSLRSALLLVACVLLLAAVPLARAHGSEGSCGGDAAPESDGPEMCLAPPAVTAHAAPAGERWASSSPTLARIRARGHLVCAHVDFTLGHSFVQSETQA